MKLLALDTAATSCSVALLTDAGLLETRLEAERVQAETLLPMVEKLLAEAGLSLRSLDAVAFGRGPGAFTGLRVAAAVTQGLAYGADLPVVPVSNLAALAAAAHTRHGAEYILACLDARMQEVYWAAYRVRGDSLVSSAQGRLGHSMAPSAQGRLGDSLEVLAQECLSPPGELNPPPGARWFGAGSGWDAYPEALKARVPGLQGVDGTLTAAAGDIARLAYSAFRQGSVVSPEQAIPVYLRDNVATPKL